MARGGLRAALSSQQIWKRSSSGQTSNHPPLTHLVALFQRQRACDHCRMTRLGHLVLLLGANHVPRSLPCDRTEHVSLSVDARVEASYGALTSGHSVWSPGLVLPPPSPHRENGLQASTVNAYWARFERFEPARVRMVCGACVAQCLIQQHNMPICR
jgi:hypothetical protein